MSQMTTPPSAPEVDVLAVLNLHCDCDSSEIAAGHYRAGLLCEKSAAVAALLTREAALVAERDALKDDRDQLNSDYLTAINAANVIAGKRDALAAEVGALRLDALRWREVSDKAWFVDAASYVYGLRTGSFGPTCDMDEVVSAIDAARAEAEHG